MLTCSLGEKSDLDLDYPNKIGGWFPGILICLSGYLIKVLIKHGREFMSWSNNFTVADRAFASLAYLLPMLSVLGQFAVTISPVLQFIYGLSPLAIVIALYFFVLKNQKISRLIRFNVLQAMLLGALLSLLRIVIGLLMPLIGPLGLLLMILTAVAIGGICIYCVVFTVQGKYAEIRELSKNTHLWVDNI
jgi:Chloroplast import apparatus Tic20-like